MGKSFPQQLPPTPIHLKRTMRIQVMSDQRKNSPDSGICNLDGLPVVSSVELDEVDVLKSQIKAKALGCHAEELRDRLDAPELKEDFDKSLTHISTVFKSQDGRLDDTDATLSISSDNTIEYDPSDSQTKIAEGSLNKLTLNGEQKFENGYISSDTAKTKQNACPGYHKVMPSPVFTDDLPVNVGSSSRFSKVLENISLPLLYIPTTKQLVKSNGTLPESLNADSNNVHTDYKLLTPEKGCSCNESESASSTLDLSSSELLCPHSSIHKAHSAQEFSYKYTDSDRCTLHSLDSYPGFHHNFEPSPYLFADNSSLSSVSTGTDFSVSAVSVGEEYNIESNDVSDDALFMDINLHSRNSFDKGYNSSSLDSGYGDKRAPQFQETAKKKSFTSLK